MEKWKIQRIRREIFLIRNTIKKKLWNFVIVDRKRRASQRKSHPMQIIRHNKGSHINSKAYSYSKRLESIWNQNDIVRMEEKILLQNQKN